MSSLLKIKEFETRFTVNQITKISGSFKKFTPDVMFLPENAMIHFIAETSTELGIDKSFSLLRNYYNATTIYHVKELKAVVGSPSAVRGTTIKQLIIAYHRTHLEIKELSNLDRSVSLEKNPIVVNYALLARVYSYPKHVLSEYHEWMNIRTTMWDTIAQIGSRREHFIRFKLPLHLQTKNELNKCLSGFNSSDLNNFHTKDDFDLMELWQILHPQIETPVTKISDSILSNVFLTFIESGVIAIISLGELIEWAVEDYETATNSFHKFLDTLIGLRSPIDLKQLESDSADLADHVDVDSKIVKLINTHGDVGNISHGEQKALLKLSERYKTIKDPAGSGFTVEELTKGPQNKPILREALINDPAGAINQDMLYSSVDYKEKAYVKDVMHKNMLQMILKLQDGGIIVKDIKLNKRIDAANKQFEYTVAVTPVAGEASTLPITIPVIEPDGSFLLGATKYRLDAQKGEMPVVKTKSNTVALTSYYSKIFIIRTESANLNYSRWISKILLNQSEAGGVVTDLVHGISHITDKVPRGYSAIGENYKSFTVKGQYAFTFAYSDINTNFTPEEVTTFEQMKLVPCGRDLKSKSPIGMDAEGKIYLVVIKDKKDGMIYLGTIPNLISEDLGNGPNEFTEFGMFGKRVPIILALMMRDGLEKTLKNLHVEYSINPVASTRIVFDPTKLILKCKDSTYVIDITNPFRRLIVSGLYVLRDISTRYKAIDFNHTQSYGSIFSAIGLSSHYIKEIDLMWDMFIDPITEELLTVTKEPTNFKDLLLHASDLLIDDHMPDVTSVRNKGYERICGMVYRELVLAMREHRGKGSSVGSKFTLNPNAIMMSIQQDQTQTLVEESNPIHNLKEKESVTCVGAGGRNTDTMMHKDRGFTKHDFGILSTDTPDSGKVGVRGSLAPDANYTSVYGTVEALDPATAKNPVQVLSTSMLLAPGATHDDGRRGNFIGIQNSHTVGCENYDALPYCTGYEEVVAGRTDELFAIKAKEDGTAEKVTASMLTVIFKGAGKVNYEIGVRHGIASGKVTPHNRVTDLRAGDKFNKNDILIWDSGFFERSLINPNNVVHKQGILARFVFVDNALTNEDGCVITDKFASKIYTMKTKLHAIIIDFDMIVHNLVTVGTEVTPETILCTLEGFVHDALQTKDPEAIKALSDISAGNPKAKVYGKITNMDMVYYGKIEDMHSSMQELATKFDNSRAKRVNTFNLDEAKTGKISSSIRVGGIKLEPNQMAIRIYIDDILDMNTGDKGVVCHQLKTTISSVTPDPITTEDGQELDGEFAYLSISNRIVESVIIVGMACEILAAGTKNMVKIYKSH